MARLKGDSKSALLCLLFSALGLLVASKAYAAAEVLEMTSYHAGEVPPNVGKGNPWLGLFQTKDGHYELKKTKVLLTLVSDPIADDSLDKKTGKKISIDGMGEPIILVRGVSSLKAGRVPACGTTKEHIAVGETLKMKLGATVSQLRITGKKKDKEISTDYKIVLECGGIKQELYKRAELGVDGRPSLLWSGDLDLDGKIDLIMNMTDHYNVRKITLFLSGKAKPGKLVEQVAFIESSGC